MQFIGPVGAQSPKPYLPFRAAAAQNIQPPRAANRRHQASALAGRPPTVRCLLPSRAPSSPPIRQPRAQSAVSRSQPRAQSAVLHIIAHRSTTTCSSTAACSPSIRTSTGTALRAGWSTSWPRFSLSSARSTCSPACRGRFERYLCSRFN
jgi:hypothetical protein